LTPTEQIGDGDTCLTVAKSLGILGYTPGDEIAVLIKHALEHAPTRDRVHSREKSRTRSNERRWRARAVLGKRRLARTQRIIQLEPACGEGAPSGPAGTRTTAARRRRAACTGVRFARRAAEAEPEQRPKTSQGPFAAASPGIHHPHTVRGDMIRVNRRRTRLHLRPSPSRKRT
jgi:hypothetical protein